MQILIGCYTCWIFTFSFRGYINWDNGHVTNYPFITVYHVT